MRRSAVALLTLLLAAVALATTGCAEASPVTETREALGTSFAMSVYVIDADSPDVRAGLDRAFAEVTAVADALSPYDAGSAIAAFNLAPTTPRALPADALEVIARIHALGVDDSFTPALFGVTKLYDFGGPGTVPTASVLASATALAATFRVEDDGTAAFHPARGRYPMRIGPSEPPGLDFGGASKGLALDRAAARFAGAPALLTSGSSTLAIGSKPDGEPWRVGVEDPRDVGRVLAVVSAEGTLSVSTSGDYQTFFERDGVRYHHIIDPRTGAPARGLRSLTVFGRMPALDADILSTALFVMGRDAALAYARERGVGVYLVDERGTPASHVPRDTGVTLEVRAEPVR